MSYNDFLNLLSPLFGERDDDWTKRSMELYNENYKMFSSDINKRMAMQTLDKHQMEIFQLIVARNIERRGEYAVNFLAEWMKKRIRAENIELKHAWKQREELLDEVVKIVPCMECLSLLFFGYRNSDEKEMDFKWEIEFKDFKGNIVIVISSTIETANFDIFGFIGKELKDEETDKFKKALGRAWLMRLFLG